MRNPSTPNGKFNINDQIMDLSTDMETAILPIDARRIGKIIAVPQPHDLIDELAFELSPDSTDAHHLKLAADRLRSSTVPVAFGTETVYGLGADATRSAAALGIYRAKQRPLDNPLIVHIASLHQLRSLLDPNVDLGEGFATDPIPEIYKPLIRKFWPGPLTIICPNPINSRLAPEVTAGLDTFGARMPKNIIALALIKLADVPVAAPSANASTKPSPTAAEHVLYDLRGRIEIILDSGPCDVGVESTVVDGLSSPPLVLRPGGISLEQLRECSGWEETMIGYKNGAETDSKPKAPGMKYRHYSPKAPVILFEAGQTPPSLADLSRYAPASSKIGIIRTNLWDLDPKMVTAPITTRSQTHQHTMPRSYAVNDNTGLKSLLATLEENGQPAEQPTAHLVREGSSTLQILDVHLGSDVSAIARGIFAALRNLDRCGVDAILIEGINDDDGDTAAAVMNRVRKAAEILISKDI